MATLIFDDTGDADGFVVCGAWLESVSQLPRWDSAAPESPAHTLARAVCRTTWSLLQQGPEPDLLFRGQRSPNLANAVARNQHLRRRQSRAPQSALRAKVVARQPNPRRWLQLPIPCEEAARRGRQSPRGHASRDTPLGVAAPNAARQEHVASKTTGSRWRRRG